MRKLLLVAAAAIAAMALSASTAAAINPVEVVDNGVHCGFIDASEHEATGGCHLQALSIGDIHLEIHTWGMETTGPACENDFEVRLDENGEGYVQHFAIFPGETECGTGVRACNEAEAHALGNGQWRVHIEEIFTGQETATVEVCMIFPGGLRCEGEIGVQLVKVAEQYTAEVTDQPVPCVPGVRAELTGRYLLVNEPDHEIHIVHPPG